MISSITVEGIKTFQQRAELALRNLTLLSGANSAGKSTLFQALLILKQTSEAMPANGSVRLNGALMNLGTGQILCAPKAFIGVSFDHDANGQRVKVIEVTLVRDNAEVLLDSLTVRLDGGTAQSLRRNIPGEPGGDAIQAFCEEQNVIGDLYRYGEETVIVRGLTPVNVVRAVQHHTTQQQREIDDLVKTKLSASLREYLLYETDVANHDDRTAREFAIGYLDVDDVSNGIRMMGRISSIKTELDDPEAVFQSVLDEDLAHYVSRQHQEFISSVGPLLDILSIEKLLREKILSWQYSLPAFEIIAVPDELEFLKKDVVQLLENILYLGPLREVPELVHEDILVSSISNLGANGSSMAPYLYYNGNAPVETIEPVDVDSMGSTMGDVLELPLMEAMNLWIRYLGLGHELQVSSNPPYGLTVNLVLSDGGQKVSLPNVGVGISQVLPILTLGLSARQGQIVILEQPELHLHPALQSKLGDFLILLAKRGVQVIVETHSEHLLNRARFFVSQKQLNSRDLSVAFIVRDEEGSHIKPISVDGSGFLDAWPDGFFDETEKMLFKIAVV